VLVFHVAYPISVGVFQEQDAKLCVLGADLLGDVDPSLPSSEPYQLNQGRLPTCKVMVEGYDVLCSMLASYHVTTTK